MTSWISLRKQLYRQIRANVQALLGESSKGLLSYQAQYEQEFRTQWKPVDRKSLIDRLDQTRLLYLADFHALQQSQKAHVRILKGLHHSRLKILAVEFFEAQHQKKVDLFMQGKLSEGEFLKEIQWQRRWGFSWDHYRPIIRWAQKNRVRIIGINLVTKEQGSRTLYVRDRFAAENIVELLRKYIDHQIVVIFGDWHLANPHLPFQVTKRLREKIDSVRVYQNSEKIFFQLIEKEKETTTDAVKLTANSFCLMSVPPWVKWQNYLMEIEKHVDRELDSSPSHSFLEYIERYLDVLQKDLDCKSTVHEFSVMTPSEDLVWGKLNQSFAGQALKWLSEMIEESRSFFIPEISMAFLGKPSVNSAAGLAMLILYAAQTKQKTLPMNFPKDFQKLIWLEMIQYFGSKMINPKRKTETIADIKAALATRNPIDKGREALRLALAQKMNELIWMSQHQYGKLTQKPLRKRSYREAAHLLGGILGEKLFIGYRQRLISTKDLKRLLFRPFVERAFDEFYLESVEIIEGMPDPFLSKQDKI